MDSFQETVFGQTLVERLVRAHTNILLEKKLDEWIAEVLPWELDMLIEEPNEVPRINSIKPIKLLNFPLRNSNFR